MNVTVSLEKHMDNAFEKFHNNLKFYNIDVSSELLDHLDTLEAAMYRLSKETRTTELEERFEDGYLKGMVDGSQDAYDEGYNMGYGQGYDAADEEFKEKIMGDT